MRKTVVLCAAAAAVSVAHAQVMVFTSRAAWEAAVGGAYVLENLNGAAVQTIAPGATLDTGLLQITRDGSPNNNDGDLEIRPGTSFGNIDGTNFLYGETGIEPHEMTHFGFNGQDVFAFGADFVSPYSGDGIDIVAGGTRYSLSGIGGGSGFLGMVDLGGASLGAISFAGSLEPITFQELWQADNISYAAVPAPAGFALIGLGGLIALRRKR
jgi:hypothetical protein